MKKLLGLFLLLPLFASAQSAFEGTWKVNLKNIQFSQKPEVFELKNGLYTCSTCIPKVSVKADGTDQKVPGAKDYDTVAVKQVDDKSIQMTRKKDGKTIGESTLSSDGKTLNVSYKYYPPQGDPVNGMYTETRVGTAPTGAHVISGSWKMNKVESASDAGLTFSYKNSGDGLVMSAPTGESYDAKFDGKDYPVKSDRAGGFVSLKKVSDTNVIETYKQDGKGISINDMTVTGKTMKIVSKDVRRNTTDTYTADKQ